MVERTDSYALLSDMEPVAEEDVSLLAPEQSRTHNDVDTAALSVLATHKLPNVDGTGNGGPDERARRGALMAARRWLSSTKRAATTRRMRDVIDQVLELHNPGAAPGIDPKRSKYHHLATKWCLPAKITVVDYDSKALSVYSGLDGVEQLSAFLSRPRERPRSRVRWIHVDGLNWEVIQVLALKFDLHPLALEDTVHVPQRIKADFYDSCLYVSLLYLYLDRCDSGDDADEVSSSSVATAASAAPHARLRTRLPPPPPPLVASSSSDRLLRRSVSTVTKGETMATAAAATSRPLSRLGSTTSAATAAAGGGTVAVAVAATPPLDLEGDGGFFEQRYRGNIIPGPALFPLPLRHGSLRMPATPCGGGGGSMGAAARKRPAASGSGSGGFTNLDVSAQQVSLFLLRGEHPNTLITIFQSDGSEVTEPILEQLREQRTLVREAEDASFLANLVIDTLVDHIFPVVSAYREQLQQYEVDVTGSGPSAAASTRELHAMQRDLRRIDRTIAPLQAVVANMVYRDATPLSSSSSSSNNSNNNTINNNNNNNVLTSSGGSGGGSSRPPMAPLESSTASLTASGPGPFLSPLTCTYLNDVRDHVATICEDLLSLSTECGDLIGLIFNLTTLQQSQSTQTLAVVSTIFLPITFLAGVYGMNFDTLPELHWSYGYVYFWLTSAAIVVVFMAVMQRAGLWSWSRSSW